MKNKRDNVFANQSVRQRTKRNTKNEIIEIHFDKLSQSKNSREEFRVFTLHIYSFLIRLYTRLISLVARAQVRVIAQKTRDPVGFALRRCDPSPLSQVMFLSLSFSLSISLPNDASGRRAGGGHRLDEDKKQRVRYPMLLRVLLVSPFNSAFLTAVNAVIHVPCSYDSRVRHTISFCTPISNLLLRNSAFIIDQSWHKSGPIILQAADYNAITHFPLIILVNYRCKGVSIYVVQNIFSKKKHIKVHISILFTPNFFYQREAKIQRRIALPNISPNYPIEETIIHYSPILFQQTSISITSHIRSD